MKTLFIVAAIFVPIYATANLGVGITSTTGKVFLEFKDCSKIETIIKNFGSEAPENCSKKTSSWFHSKCEFEVTDCFPEMIRQLHGVKSQINGLNSFNASLFVAGLDPAFRHTSSKEFHFYMTSPLCRKLPEGEPKAVKDIVAIRDADGDDVSAASFLNEDMVFEKKGSEPLSLYMIEWMDSFKKTNIGESTNHVEIFRCESLDSYLKKQPADLANMVRFQEQITQAELEVATTLPVKTALTAAQATHLQNQIKELVSQFNSEAKKKSLPSPARVFLSELFKMRLLGIASHLKENTKSVSESDVEIKTPLIQIIETSVVNP